MLAPVSRGGKGQVVTLHQPGTDGGFDPMTETAIAPTPPTDHTGSGVEGEAYSAFSISSGLVSAGDVRFLLSPMKADGTPMPTPVADEWTLTLGGVVHTIKAVDTTKPAGVPVMYELRLRA